MFVVDACPPMVLFKRLFVPHVRYVTGSWWRSYAWRQWHFFSQM